MWGSYAMETHGQKEVVPDNEPMGTSVSYLRRSILDTVDLGAANARMLVEPSSELVNVAAGRHLLYDLQSIMNWSASSR